MQFIERSEVAIDDRFMKINRDSRHTNVIVIETADIISRYFGQWDLAYSGPDEYIDRKLMGDLQRGVHHSDAIRAEELRSSLLRMAFHK
jgi:hypothetical protein